MWLLEVEARAESIVKGGENIIRDDKYEVSEMCQIFWGPWAKHL